MQASLNDLAKEEQMIQLVIFHIQNEEFGVHIDEIQEIIKLEKITPIPDAPKFIKGIINVRGDIVTTIDMNERLFLKQGKDLASRHIVITKQNNNIFGLVVDEVTEVLKINMNEIKSANNLISQVHQDYIRGTLVADGRLVIILDLSKILSESEFDRLSKFHKKHQETPVQEEDSERKTL